MRPLSTFPWKVYRLRPGQSPERGMALRRVRDGVVTFLADGGRSQVMVQEHHLVTAYDLHLTADQLSLMTLLEGAADAGYAFEQKPNATKPGTTHKITGAQDKALVSLASRGLTEERDGRFHITTRGTLLRAAFHALNAR